MKYIDTEGVIAKSWRNNPEGNALAQAKNLANLPFIFRQVCLMPDAHEGYGMPIGGVIASNDPSFLAHALRQRGGEAGFLLPGSGNGVIEQPTF
jgi:hypothetical protein